MLNRCFVWLSIIWSLCCSETCSTLLAETLSWKVIDEGLYISEVNTLQKPEIENSKITIIKIDPLYYEFKLLCASEYNQKPRTPRQWAKDFKLTAVVNAGMYQEDYLTSVGYLKNFSHLNNAYINRNKAVFAFSPKDTLLKKAQIIDRNCQNFDSLRHRYDCFLQSIRMISCNQENVWEKQTQKWSMVVLGIDKSDNILFIFTPSPYSAHDFSNILLSLPLSLYNAMYLEGGPQASLYLSANDTIIEKFGRFPVSFLENTTAWTIPNVLGIIKKER